MGTRRMGGALMGSRGNGPALTFLICFLLGDTVSVGRRGVGVASRPIAKTIQTTAGDTFDCVDIYKQPSLSHPSLRDHKIQMFPSWLHISHGANATALTEEGETGGEGFQSSRYEVEGARVELEGGGCPEGTVPIHRLPLNITADDQPQIPNVKYYAARFTEEAPYYGASASINVYEVPGVGPAQMSASMIWIYDTVVQSETDIGIIQAGWAVSPDVFGDQKTRLLIAWTVDGEKTMCYNHGCPGFVQVNPKVPLGAQFSHVSVIGQTQYVINIFLIRDTVAGNWWFSYGTPNNTVGYWPGSIFKSGFRRANGAMFGGFTYCPRNAQCPAMCNGLNPNDELRLPCFVNRVRVMRDGVSWVGLEKKQQNATATDPQCYNVGPYEYAGASWEWSFRFGGNTLGKVCYLGGGL